MVCLVYYARSICGLVCEWQKASPSYMSILSYVLIHSLVSTKPCGRINNCTGCDLYRKRQKERKVKRNWILVSSVHSILSQSPSSSPHSHSGPGAQDLGVSTVTAFQVLAPSYARLHWRSRLLLPLCLWWRRRQGEELRVERRRDRY